MNDIQDNRIGAFRQLKKEIRGSTDHLIVGIDAAKDRHNAFGGTANGQTLFKRLVFDNTRQGFEKLTIHADAAMAKHNLSKIVFGLEPTANYHKPLAEYLIREGYPVVLVSTGAVKKNRELLDGRWDKNDTKDPANVADLISQGKCLFFDFPDDTIRELRSLLSLKKKLKKQDHSLRMRIRNHLVAQYFPEMDRYFGSLEDECLAIVKHCQGVEHIAEMSYEAFQRLTTRRKRGLAQQKRLFEIWQKASDSIGCDISTATVFEGNALVDSLKQNRDLIKECDKRMAALCKPVPEYRILLSIPGFGPSISASVLGAIGNPHRFNNRKQVLKLVGLDLSASRSGKSSANAVAVISKKGKADLRYALYQAALIASSRNTLFIEYFTGLIKDRQKERGIKTRMRVKLAAKMLTIAWTLMKRREPFNPEFLVIKQRKKRGCNSSKKTRKSK
ncbi:MAG: IS110 family transposase [Planctomycetes bacterium]|nr:IS110 family transposase [Planctomycetota bacterium]